MRRRVRKHLQQVAVESRLQDLKERTGGVMDPSLYEGAAEKERRLWLEKLPTQQPIKLPLPPVSISNVSFHVPTVHCEMEYEKREEDEEENSAATQRPLPGTIVSCPHKLPPFLASELGTGTSNRTHLLMHGSSPLLPTSMHTSSASLVAEVAVPGPSASAADLPPLVR